MKYPANHTIKLEIFIRESEMEIFKLSEKTDYKTQYLCTLNKTVYGEYNCNQFILELVNVINREVENWNLLDSAEDDSDEYNQI